MTSHLPVGRLAGYLEAVSKERIWFAMVASSAAIATLDVSVPAVDFAPLYIPVVCAAAWSFDPIEAYLVAVITALLAVMPSLHSGLPMGHEILALRVLIRIAVFLFLAAAIMSFRRSYDRERFHAHRDRMTGTLNKEVFEQRCSKALQDAVHSGQTLLLIILDLDDFKAVNSSEGHQAGDEVLRTFANGASSIVRREDLIGRIGGDEFALLVQIPSIAVGEVFAGDIHTRMSGVLAASRYPVTCSMGALLIPADSPRNGDEFMRAADQAMYRAKETGKNAVIVARADSSALATIPRALGEGQVV